MEEWSIFYLICSFRFFFVFRSHFVHSFIHFFVWSFVVHLFFARLFLISMSYFLYSRVLRDSTPRFVGRSVGLLVTLYFFYDFCLWISLLLPKWSSDLKYGPCPPARDWGSRVSGLVPSFLRFFLSYMSCPPPQ